MKTVRRTRTITWEDPAPAFERAASLTGLEYLRDIFEGRLPPPPIASSIGFAGIEVGDGSVVFRGEAGEHLYNPIGVVHGGFAMTILDSAMACAIQTTCGVGERYTTLETKVNFVRPITVETGPVRCEASVVHRGTKIATAEGRLTSESTGKLLAHGTSTCLLMS
jgi:uncharacterized protein (TIGR00369 family)